MFHKLVHKDMIRIVELESEKVVQRMKDKEYELELTPEAKEFLVDRGTDEKFGARPLRRAIEHLLEDQLSEGDFTRRI